MLVTNTETRHTHHVLLQQRQREVDHLLGDGGGPVLPGRGSAHDPDLLPRQRVSAVRECAGRGPHIRPPSGL